MSQKKLFLLRFREDTISPSCASNSFWGLFFDFGFCVEGFL